MCLLYLCISAALIARGQSLLVGSILNPIPPVIEFSGVAIDQDGNPLVGAATITFSLYNEVEGGMSLWSERQDVSLDSSGHYTVDIGIASPEGVPWSLFTNNNAHWLGVRIGNQAEGPRTLLVSVPYAMKAQDATTLGGLPPSAFVRAPVTEIPSANIPSTIGGSGDPQWSTAPIPWLTAGNSTNTGVTPPQMINIPCGTSAEVGSLINAAAASLSATGGVINIMPGTCTLTTPVMFNYLYKPFLLQCAPGYATTINVTLSSGAAVSLNWGWNGDPGAQGPGSGAGVIGCTLVNEGGGSSVAIEMAGSNGGAGQDAVIANNSIVGFGIGLDNGGGGTSGFKMEIANNRLVNDVTGINLSAQAENVAIENNLIANNSTGLFVGGATDAQVLKNSFDANSKYAVQTNGAGVYFFGNHFEDSNLAGDVNFQYLYISNSHVIMVGDSMAEDRSSCSGFGNCTSLVTVTATECCTYFQASGLYLSGLTPYKEFANLANINVTALLDIANPGGRFPLLYNPGTPATVTLLGFSGFQQPAVPFSALSTTSNVGTSEFCSNCVPTAPSSCSTNNPGSCVCKAGMGSMTARFENFMNNGANWYCH
jgi:hypothetical protein